MKKWLKPLLWMFLATMILLFSSLTLFIYKVKYGLPFYETEPPALDLKKEDFNVLIFSKTNGYNHSSAIEASIPVFKDMAKRNNWQLHITDKAGAFNEEQLPLFDVVVWNNTSGRVLREFQRKAFESYITEGGSFLGIHAAGDDSHHWEWYYDNLICARFSHHPIKKQIQEAKLHLQTDADSVLSGSLAASFTQNDEWYIFYESPTVAGAKLLYTMDGNAIDTDGNMLWIKNKTEGMGEVHPNIWYKSVGKGKTVYSALGHTPETYSNRPYVDVLEKAISWLGADSD